MGKLKFLFGRVANLNWKQMFQKIDEVHKNRDAASFLYSLTWSGADCAIRPDTWTTGCLRCTISTPHSEKPC